MPTAVELKDAIIANIEADTGNTQVVAAQTVWLAASKAIVPHLGGGGGIVDGDKGDVVVTGSGSIWTIDTNVVSLTKLAQIATGRFLGRTSGGSGNVEALTGTQATALLDTFTAGVKGLAPASGGGTANFLRADGAWAAPTSGGNGSAACACDVVNAVVSQNLSDLSGVVDWLAFGATLGAANNLAAITTVANTHAKKDGPGWLADCNLQFVLAGIGLTALSQTGSTTIAANAADSTNNGAYNSTNGVGYHTPGALGSIGWGWKLSLFVPGDNVARTFSMWGNQFNLATRLSARLYDAAGTSHTADADNGGSSTTRQIKWSVTYSSPVATWLEVRAAVITNYTTNSNLKIQAMAISQAA